MERKKYKNKEKNGWKEVKKRKDDRDTEKEIKKKERKGLEGEKRRERRS